MTIEKYLDSLFSDEPVYDLDYYDPFGFDESLTELFDESLIKLDEDGSVMIKHEYGLIGFKKIFYTLTIGPKDVKEFFSECALDDYWMCSIYRTARTSKTKCPSNKHLSWRHGVYVIPGMN